MSITLPSDHFHEWVREEMRYHRLAGLFVAYSRDKMVEVLPDYQVAYDQRRSKITDFAARVSLYLNLMDELIAEFHLVSGEPLITRPLVRLANYDHYDLDSYIQRAHDFHLAHTSILKQLFGISLWR